MNKLSIFKAMALRSFFIKKSKEVLGGLSLVIVIALSSSFLSTHYQAPTMLFALLIGIAFNFLSKEKNCIAGIEFASGSLLRLGVGLLGLKLTFSNVESVGFIPIASVLLLVSFTLLSGVILSFVFGRKLGFGILAGGAVAICGASAALSIAAALPSKKELNQDVLFVVIGVTVLSTISMIIYPVLFKYLGMNNIQSGYLIGATVHDIAQVVGAGYSISEDSGIIATFIKMIRVSTLPVVILVVAYLFKEKGVERKLSLPWFIFLFIILALANNVITIPVIILNFLNNVSMWFLIIAISALGVKTNLAQIASVSKSYSFILIVETLFLLCISLGAVALIDF